MNAAEKRMREVFQFGATIEKSDVFKSGGFGDHLHPEIQFSMFGPSGTKEFQIGRDNYLNFVEKCAALLSDRSDEIVSITSADEEIAIVTANAWRKSKSTGEEIHYQWVMLYRVEDGLVTYAADMLDRDAQEFWGRICP